MIVPAYAFMERFFTRHQLYFPNEWNGGDAILLRSHLVFSHRSSAKLAKVLGHASVGNHLSELFGKGICSELRLVKVERRFNQLQFNQRWLSGLQTHQIDPCVG